MPVSNNNTFTVSTANGVTTVFPYNFTLLSTNDLVVTVAGVVVTTGFTVSGVGNSAGGNITFSVAPANGAEVLRKRVVSLTRSTDYQYVGSLSSEVLDADFDRLWLAMQQVDTKSGLIPTLPVNSYPGVSFELPAPLANGYWRWNATATAIEYVTFLDTQATPVTPYAAALVLSANAAAARAILATPSVTEMNAAISAAETISASSQPAYIEQFISGLFGRGMLTAEAINVVTEQALTATAAAGAITLACTDATNFTVGGCVTVKHDNGKYGTYFVSAKTSNNIDIRPSLRFACVTAAARIERTWYNRAHPGKFYMRELAQRIAHSTELDAAMPSGGRVLYTNLSSNPNTREDTIVSVGGATVQYYDAANTGISGTAASPVRFTMGRSAYVEGITAVGQGAETNLFNTDGVTDAVVKLMFHADTDTNSRTYVATIIDELGVERGRFLIPGGSDQRVMRIYSFAADLRGVTQIKVRIAAATYGGTGGYFTVGQIDVFEAPPAASKIIAGLTAKIVCLGDSWVAGDLSGSLQREPITQQLAIELPSATIINAGVGGNTIIDEIARFDTDVAPHAPDYVVINTGTNETYNPLSATFDPNAIKAFLDQYSILLAKIASIGARAIIIGVPALAQSDADVPALTEWQLNDRARGYSRYFFEWQSKKPFSFVRTGSDANGDYVKFDDGTMICRKQMTVTTSAANTLASTSWTFPAPFIAAPRVVASVANYSTNQVVSTGSNSNTTTTSSICVVSGSSGVELRVDAVATGRWRT